MTAPGSSPAQHSDEEAQVCKEAHQLVHPMGFYAHYIWRKVNPDGKVMYAIEVHTKYKAKPIITEDCESPVDAYYKLLNLLSPTSAPVVVEPESPQPTVAA